MLPPRSVWTALVLLGVSFAAASEKPPQEGRLSELLRDREPELEKPAREKRRPPLSPATAAALAKATDRADAKTGALLERLASELQVSARSYRYLRTIGFSQTDAEFDALVAKYPELLRQTRIIRRDEQGNRVLPGWPAAALKTK